MAISLLAANNAQSVLAAGISAAATTLTVNTGTGGLFPSPVPGTSFFKLTLIDAATGTLTEIVHVTQRVGDQMTIERGQEGTAARIWSANDLVANMMTAGTLSYLKQDIDNKLPKTGTAAAATKLATARTINGVAFDGSADITITAAANGVTAATTTGNAGTATKLATARTINGVAFDGTANISISASTMGSYTKDESDARYVRDVQRGAVSKIYTPESTSTDAPKGCVMVGVTLSGDGSSGTHVYEILYRPLQIKINGEWRTISDITDSK